VIPASALSPRGRSPNRAIRVHPALDQIPYRVPHHLPAVRPVGRTSSHEVPAPCDDVTRISPVWSGFRPPRPGPALRFSQPRGGFLADPSLRPCFVPLPSLGSPLPSELHLAGIAAPLSGPPAPLRSSPRACVRRRGLVTSGFADALPGLPGLLPVSPRSYGCPFSVRAMVRPASRSPWTARGGLTPDHAVHPLRSLDPPATSAPPTPRVSPQEWPCSPGISPLQSLLHPPLGT